MGLRNIILVSLLLLPTCSATGQPANTSPSPSPSGSKLQTSPNNDKQSDLNSSERFDYEKLRLERDLQKELLDWAQTRFWILAVLVFLIGFFGVRALVREMISSELKEATQAAAKAQAAADQTIEVTKVVRADADQYRAMVGKLSETATNVDRRFKELDARISAEGAHAVASSELQLSQLSQRIDELSDVVKAAASESRESREAVRRYEDRVGTLRNQAAHQRARFSENSQYDVIVVVNLNFEDNHNFGEQLISELTRRGFRSSRGSWDNNHPKKFGKIDIHYKSGLQHLGENLRTAAADLVKKKELDLSIDMQEGPDVTVGDRDAVIFID